MKPAAAFLSCVLLGGLVIQPGLAHADTRDLLDHVNRQQAQQVERDQRWEERREDQRDERRSERRMQRHGRGIGAEEAAKRAQQRNGGGRVLDVNPSNEGYRVKLLKQGEVRTLLITDGEGE